MKNITSPSPSDSNVSIDGSTSHLLSNTHVVIPTRALSCPMGFCEMALGLLHQLVKCHANNTSASCLNNHHSQPQSSLAPASSSLQVLIRPSVWVLLISFLGLEAQLEPSTPHFHVPALYSIVLGLLSSLLSTTPWPIPYAACRTNLVYTCLRYGLESASKRKALA